MRSGALIRGVVAIGLGSLSLVAATTGCLIQIEPQISCGDGYVDTRAGEQCDPQDPLRAFESACVDAGLSSGNGACDPETCQLIVSERQCAFCGDGIAEGLEPCDGSDLRSPPCVQARCTAECTIDDSDCPTCGNAQSDPEDGEECDASQFCRDAGPPDAPGPDAEARSRPRDCVDPDDPLVTVPIQCSTDLAVLAVGIDTPQYAGGSVTMEDCQDQCVYSRENCNFCGNGILEPQHDDIGANGNYFTRAPEVCEIGPAGDNAESRAFCAQYCTPGDPTAAVLCALECKDACSRFELLHQGDPLIADPLTELGCCLAKGEPCGGPGQAFPCCGAAGDPQGACQLVVNPTGSAFRCVPNGPPTKLP